MTAELWSAKPYVAYDGPDETGLRAEVKIQKGYGLIKSITPSDKGKAMQVHFNSGHPKWSSSGWLPITDPVLKLVEKAQEDGVPIYYRIETRRKPEVDRSEPIFELSKTADSSKEFCAKSVAAVRLDEADDWTLSPTARTRIDEDPSFGGAVNANDFSLEELRKMSAKSSGSNAPAAAPAHYSEAGEGSPFTLFLHNRDGEKVISPGAAAVAVPLNVLSFMSEYFREQQVPATEKDIFRATKLVLHLCNELQKGVFGGKLTKPDLGAGSHTRARALVFDALKSDFPLSSQELTEADAAKAWHEKTYAKLLAKWQWSIKETDRLMGLLD